MNRKLVLRVLLLVSLLYELMILAGCSNEVVGKLSVRISDANSRGINSSTPMDVDHYTLTLYDKDHIVITDHILYPSVSVVDFSLEPGEYILQVEAKNEYGFIIGEGYRDAEVVAGERNCVTINVTEVEGYGEFNVSILANRGLHEAHLAVICLPLVHIQHVVLKVCHLLEVFGFLGLKPCGITVKHRLELVRTNLEI